METITSIKELNEYVARFGGIVDANVKLYLGEGRWPAGEVRLPEALQKVNGYLIVLDCTNLASLGGLKEVGGSFNLAGEFKEERDHRVIYHDTALTSLGALEKVGRGLDIKNCPGLTSLGDLKKVGSGFDVNNCPDLVSLGDLKEVGEEVDIKNCLGLTDLGCLEQAGGYVCVKWCPSLISLGYLDRVNGDLVLNSCSALTSLGSIERVRDLQISNCPKLITLGCLKRVRLDLRVRDCPNLASLGELETVGRNCDLFASTRLTSLGNLRDVGGELNLRGCTGLPVDLTAYLSYAKRVTFLTDENRRLHCADGPVSGELEYYWHGVRVPGYVILSPEQITVADINDTENTEVRRVKIFRYGLARYMQDTNAELLDDDPRYGKLWRMVIAGGAIHNGSTILSSRRVLPDQIILMLEVVNSTAEPDGTFKTYFIPVRPTCTGNPALPEGSPMDAAYKAVWSTFPTIWGLGMPYDPKVET